MNRRTLLASVVPTFGLTLAGCTAPSPSGSQSDPDQNRSEPKLYPSTPPNPTFSAPEFTDTRVDTPPYSINAPTPDTEQEEWNAEYLGEHMDSDSELSFEMLDDVEFVDRQVWPPAEEASFVAAATLLTSQSDEEETFKQFDTDIDYDQSFLVAVETGYGSGSLHHRWARAEAVSGGVHLFGYYTRPRLQTSDYSSHQSVLRVERPQTLKNSEPEARISFTLSEKSRIHFSSREGVVGIQKEEGDDRE